MKARAPHEVYLAALEHLHLIGVVLRDCNSLPAGSPGFPCGRDPMEYVAVQISLLLDEIQPRWAAAISDLESAGVGS